jgi:hypothetical protein
MPYEGSKPPKPLEPPKPKVEKIKKPDGLRIVPQYSIIDWKLPEEVELTIERYMPTL